MRLFICLALALGAAGVAGVLDSSSRAAIATGPPAAECAVAKLVGVRGSGDNTSKLGILASKVSVGVTAAKPSGLPPGSPPGVKLTDPMYGSYGLPYTAVGIDPFKPTMPLSYWLSERQGRNELRAYIREQVHD